MKLLVESYFSAFTRKDKNAWLNLFSDDGILGGPAHSPPVVGRNALGELFSAIVSLFDELKFEISAIHVQEPFAVAIFRLTSRGKNGRFDVTPGMVAFAVNSDGKLSQVGGFWDPMSVIAGATSN